MASDEVVYSWRGPAADEELSVLHAAAFACDMIVEPWGRRLETHSLGWVIARNGGALVGFVNVVGDGGRHAFLLDTAVDPGRQGQGIGAALVREAAAACRQAGTEWLHVDFEPALAGFYVRPGRFRSTTAGILHLTETPSAVDGDPARA